MRDAVPDKEQAWGEQTEQLLQKAQRGCGVHSLCTSGSLHRFGPLMLHFLLIIFNSKSLGNSRPEIRDI